MPTEEELAGASYVMSFLNDVENLTNAYAGYLNILVRIQDKYGMKDPEDPKKRKPALKIDQDDENALLSIAEGMRMWIARCYVKARTLEVKIPAMKSGERLKALYEQAISTSVITKETAEGFVMEVNSLFVEGILQDLLLKSQDVYKEVLQ